MYKKETFAKDLEAIANKHFEQCAINGVVGQREQLRAFKEFLQSEYHLPISNRMVDEFEHSSNIGEFRQEPNVTLKQAIAKAKPNLDKITDVDKFLDDIR